jgi:hypothetical protein
MARAAGFIMDCVCLERQHETRDEMTFGAWTVFIPKINFLFFSPPPQTKKQKTEMEYHRRKFGSSRALEKREVKEKGNHR